MVKKIVIEFEAGNESRLADRIFESAVKLIRKAGGRVVCMSSDDRVTEKKKNFVIPDLSRIRKKGMDSESFEKILNAVGGKW